MIDPQGYAVTRPPQDKMARLTPEETTIEDGLKIRESARARRVQFHCSVHNGVELVVPRAFDRRHLPDLIAQNRPWLERAQRRIKRQRAQLPSEYFESLPASVHLRALAKTYEIIYAKRASNAVRVRPFVERVLVDGDIENEALVSRGLHRWLRQEAKRHLPLRLRELSRELGLPYERCVIKGQKTRWGSCSSSGIINLNDKLLLFPPEVVRYLMVHELCHTRHLNHSRRFWALVTQFEPNYKPLDRALSDAWQWIPVWAG
jgi:predicted metal-dependent hydrolase